MEQDQLLALANCMRSRGVPTCPEPQIVNGSIRIHVAAG
jgi:hypothetical protein